ncbi:hypothetical protein LCGC14_0881570 [marine sediment metagenome]|uniref:Uncharacterized protein n=1 Tax=marine sediment metagenome TaxID=412755 RepID=A0A0F9PMC9_9ZZZZ
MRQPLVLVERLWLFAQDKVCWRIIGLIRQIFTRDVEDIYQHVEVTYLIGQHQDQPGIKRMTLGFRQPLMRRNQRFVKIISVLAEVVLEDHFVAPMARLWAAMMASASDLSNTAQTCPSGRNR